MGRDLILPSLQLPAVRTAYCTTQKQCIAACSTILFLSRERFTVWGFDCEWKVEFTRNGIGPVALMQFASPRLIALFHISSCGIPPPLLEILSCDTIFKVGVNISGDVAKLTRDYSLSNLQGMVDLRTLSTAIGDRPSTSLAGLVHQYLRHELPKPVDDRLSDWEIVPLSASQQHYAALDAYSGYAIFEALRARRCAQLELERDVQDEYMFSLLNKVTLSRKVTPIVSSDPVTDNTQLISNSSSTEGAASHQAPASAPSIYRLTNSSRELLESMPRHIPSSSAEVLGYSTAEISYKLFISGKSVNGIAIHRSLKLDTIVKHILQSIGRGHGYTLDLFGISRQEIENIVTAYVSVYKTLPQCSLLRPVMDAYAVNYTSSTEFWKLNIVATHMEKVYGDKWKEKFTLEPLNES